MTNDEELLKIADQISVLRKLFETTDLIKSSKNTSFDAQFAALVSEAREILGDALGPVNEFRFAIAGSMSKHSGSFYSGPLVLAADEVENQIRAAVRHLRRRIAQPKSSVSATVTRQTYVSPTRIVELQTLKVDCWDFRKLVQLCKELNIAHANDCNYAVAMLLRAITDHVPPLFGLASFREVAANHGGKSLKGTLAHLQSGLRNIADGALHEQIRRSESLPSPQQVDFSQALDALLGEVARIANERAS